MLRVRGIGGVFFKSRDPQALAAWYRDLLGFEVTEWGGALFRCKDRETGADASTVWSPVPDTTTYFEPSAAPFMLNLRVDDLDGMLRQLAQKGARVLDRRETTPKGRFGYVVDPDGTLLELWQPSGT